MQVSVKSRKKIRIINSNKKLEMAVLYSPKTILMKTRVNALTSVFILLLFLSNSCTDDPSDAELENSLCSPSSDYYFSGVVGDMLECWNYGVNNYQVYHGWGSTANQNADTIHYWQPGLDQYPIPDINKTIHLYIEAPYKITGCSSEQFHDTFQTGSFEFVPIESDGINGIEIHYSVNGTYYSTAYGPQDGSYIECLEVSEATTYGNSEKLNIVWKFRCKLYNMDGEIFNEMKIGKMRVSVLHVENE